ncbi:MAG: M20/M25/M40 family metallo-hydrolase [Anaerolineales bacterium]|uniref:M20/M25/M40 family metallo-hydrolase n=1 Tax=Candidatus Desulfolinea nitratireducens TaxID=2841698 RepID=A0A8J6TIS6_9CHLR|nr:M20/M25/M40 family metallo-hydrolase [Candidatus Desulfolinea nitratireducens]MBL6962061.1 M20/M25/M40 family metallo-hydrolase [Anaerolineales bacterium]
MSTEFLKSLISTSGLSGYETPVTGLIEEAWRPLTDELNLSALGSLHGLKRGDGQEPRPSLMIAAHMDAIGLIVTKISGEFLHLTHIGGIDIRVLPGQAVTIHGRSDLPGIIVQPPAHLLPEGAAEGAVGINHLLVDLGLSAGQVSKKVKIGDLISFATEPIEMSGGVLVGHSLDNRASVAALTLCLEELQSRQHAWDIWAAATVQEELGHMGARTSAFQLRPDLAIAVDVTFAKGPGANNWETFELESGPTIGWGSVIHPFLYKEFKELAKKLEMPYGIEILPGRSGTDGDDLQLVAEGIPTALISIPIRYMHSPIEMVALKDIQRVGRLLAEFIAMLEPDFLKKIVWDD